MLAIFSAFGVDWRLLLVDTINFALLLGALWYFLYKPLMAMIERRREIVSRGVVDAQTATERLREIEKARMEKLAAAGKEADDVLSRARKAALEKERELLGHGEAAAARIIAEAEGQAKEAKAKAIEESKREVAKLIVLGIEKGLTS